MRNFLRIWILLHAANGFAIYRIIEAGKSLFIAGRDIETAFASPGGSAYWLAIALAASVISLGVVQWILIRRQILKASCWIPATVSGLIIGFVIYIPLSIFLAPIFLALPGGRNTGAGLFVGAFIGLAQWLTTRKQLPQSGWWIAANSLGTAVSTYLHLSFGFTFFWQFGLVKVIGTGYLYEFSQHIYSGACWAIYGSITGIVMTKILNKLHNNPASAN